MTMPDGLYRWICTQNNNLPLIGLVTFSTPKRFVRSILEGNREKSLWNGKKACVTLSFDCDYPDDVDERRLILHSLADILGENDDPADRSLNIHPGTHCPTRPMLTPVVLNPSVLVALL